jgi:dTDP-4-amino-4,6-dideoxygalactose transaminase
MSYNSWPLGKLKKEHQRPEPEIIRGMGYEWDDARDIVGIFERKLADFWGSKYAVAVDCCSHAIFLSLYYYNGHIRNLFDEEFRITIPKRTYISVYHQIEFADFIPVIKDIEWQGYYYLEPTNIIDAAVYWKRGGYIPESLMCLSFQIKKMIPVGKMGAILTDSKEAYNYLKLASYDGRDLNTPYISFDHVKMFGWHYYATPEDCARAIILMDDIKTEGEYFEYLKQNYAEDKTYVQRLKQIIKKQDLKSKF